jgi:FkbM family methyltransferase|tara:strand:- start:234 stop:1139 length:906 start_codon:yes stop_codon:yes gene_type:complete
MFDYVFAKQIGLINYFTRGLFIRIKKKFFSQDIYKFKTITKKNYFIHKWDPSGTEVYLTNCFTDWGNEYLFLDSLRKKGEGVFLDIGCHTGYFSCLFNKYFKQIIGFEPSNKCIDALDIIKKEYKNFDYITSFVGQNEEIIKANDYSSGYAFDVKSINDHKNVINKIDIPKTTIDNFCKKNMLNKISGIKIDVDGIDIEVLKGAKEIIIKDRPSVIIENYSQDLIDFFTPLNYDLITLSSKRGAPYNIKIEKLTEYDNNKFIKMICCVPVENAKKYNEKIFIGNYFFGINKKEIFNFFNNY